MTCTCHWFEEYRSPCAHACGVYFHLLEDALKGFHSGYRRLAYSKTYELAIALVLMKDLKRDDKIQPPAPTKLRGRPLTKRIRKGRWTRQKTISCLVC